jgi:hypothetical protein
MWSWLVTAALAQSLTALDAAPPPAPLRLAWEEGPKASMIRSGGNGPGRLQYRLNSDPRTFGGFIADAVNYEYIDGKLATVLAVYTTRYDAEGVRTDLERAYGPPTFTAAPQGDLAGPRIWRGDRVRVVWRQQDPDLWTVSYAWLALHGGDEIPAAP